MDYGIQVLDFGEHRCYLLVKICQNGARSVDGEVYRGVEQARRAAQKLGVTPIGCGSIRELMRCWRLANEHRG